MIVLTLFAIKDGVSSWTGRLISSRRDAHNWRKAINQEMDPLHRHSTWDVVKLPIGAKVISTKFIFRKKLIRNGSVGRYKARLAVRGFMRGEVDCTFSPVVDFTTIRTRVAVTVQRGYFIHQMDVRTAFLHGVINEDVYVTPPEEYALHLKKTDALKLNKGLYGQKCYGMKNGKRS